MWKNWQRNKTSVCRRCNANCQFAPQSELATCATKRIGNLRHKANWQFAPQSELATCATKRIGNSLYTARFVSSWTADGFPPQCNCWGTMFGMVE
jgi:hypothetical protein